MNATVYAGIAVKLATAVVASEAGRARERIRAARRPQPVS